MVTKKKHQGVEVTEDIQDQSFIIKNIIINMCMEFTLEKNLAVHILIEQCLYSLN